MISAADKHVDGGPLPASLVERTESIRNWVARFFRVARDVVMEASFRSSAGIRPRGGVHGYVWAPSDRSAASTVQKTSVSLRCGSPPSEQPVCRQRSLSRRDAAHRLDGSLGCTREVLFARGGREPYERARGLAVDHERLQWSAHQADGLFRGVVFAIEEASA